MPYLSPKITCQTIYAAVEKWQALFFGVVVSGLLLLLSGCAAQGGPTGGPEDKTGPTLLNTVPADGAVKVELQPTIEFLFSEPIDPRSVEGSLSVFPRLKQTPRIAVARRRITINLAAPLSPNRTYVFNFGCNLRDYRNNPSPTEIKIAFATGDSIDAGRITGMVYDIPPNTQARVFLFPWSEDLPDSLLQLEPAYSALVNTQGEYAFTNLPPGRYRALATTGRSIRAITSDDLIALPQVEPLNLSHRTAEVEGVAFRMSKLSRQPFKLLTVNTLNGLVELNFSQEIDETSLATTQLVVTPDSIPVFNFWSPVTNPKQILLRTAPLNPAQEYRIEVEGVRSVFNQPLVGAAAQFTSKMTSDTLSPLILRTVPAPNSTDVSLTGAIRVDFSEPLDGVVYERDIIWRGKDTTAVAFSAHWPNANTLLLTPQTALLPNHPYQVRFNLGHWHDPAGNTFRDSLYTLQFTTLDVAKLGTITGRVAISQSIDYRALHIEARLRDGKEVAAAAQPDSLGYYRLENLLAGQYLLSIWEDRNGDGRYDYGQIEPYRPAERYRRFPTVVNVRARWETAEVNLDF